MTDLLSPFVFQAPGQPPLLVLRCGALFFALSVLRARRLEAAVVALLFFASLVATGALYPFLLVAAALTLARRGADATAYAVLSGSVVTAASLALLAHLKRPPAPLPTGNPEAMVAYWRTRQNPYAAREWAITWTHQQARDPGDAYLTLAALDHEIGREPQARKVLEKVETQSTNDATRARATALRAQWDSAPGAAP